MNMKLSGYMLLSLVLSLALHLLLMLFLSRMTFPASRLAELPTEEAPKRVPNIQTVDVRDLAKPKPSPNTKLNHLATAGIKAELSGISQQVNSELAEIGEQAVREILQKENLVTPAPAPSLRFAGVDKAILTPRLPNAEPPRQATAPRPEIVAIDFNDLPPARQAAYRGDVIPGVERIDVPDLHLPSLLPHGPLTAATGATYDVGIKLGPNPKFGIPEGIGGDVEDTPSAPAASSSEDLATLLKKGALAGGGGRDGQDIVLKPLAAPDIKQSPKPFDAFVDVIVTVWEDKKNGGGYFKIAITPNRESDSLRDIPKDTLIIIDHSTSIDISKLRQFKSAAVDALSYLNRQDRFNIVGFNEKPEQLFPDFVPLDDTSLAAARAYIRNLYRGGMTDVFGGIAPFVQKSNRIAQRPLNIFLLTDGKSTINIYKEDDFIRRIVEMNPGNVSIYPFSAGQDANRQLLDFLGYLNRGYNFHVPDLKQFKSQLLSYIGAHSSLIIRDLQYMIEGEVGNEIFPKRLPHLYRQETLEILGRYSPQDTELVFTLAGRDAEGNVRDLVFRRQYRDCQTASEELPLHWAAKKIFHLLSQRTLTEDPQERFRLNQEIQRLGKNYNIYIPY